MGTTGGEIIIFNKDDKIKHTWSALSGRVKNLFWLNNYLISAGSDGWIKEWNPEQSVPAEKYISNSDYIFSDGATLLKKRGQMFQNISGRSNFHFSRNITEINSAASQHIVAYCDGQPCLLNIKTREAKLLSYTPINHELEVSLISEDGALIVCAWKPVYAKIARGDSVVIERIPSGAGKISVWNRRNDTVVCWIPSRNSRTAWPCTKMNFSQQQEMVIFVFGR